MSEPVSGARALARAAVESGISLVTSYPGGPITPVVDDILALTSRDVVQVVWATNEKVALEMAFGTSLAGARSLACVKSVGLNIALDPLMTLMLSGCKAGLVLLVGDDPGAWGSQNEQDSRMLAQAADVPLLEPTSVADAREAMLQGFQLSEEVGLPVMVRVVRALVLASAPALTEKDPPAAARGGFRREFMRWVVLPTNVVPNHRRLVRRLGALQVRFEDSTLNDVEGDGPAGVIAVGFAYQKLLELFGEATPGELSVLRLGTLHPFPIERVTSFLGQVQRVLVLEETAPVAERATRAAAQGARLTLPVLGRDTAHIPREGELFGPHIAGAMNSLLPSLALPEYGETSRSMQSKVPLCDDCPFIPTFDALTRIMSENGGRDAFVIVGDPGCMVRAQLPPYELLDVKTSLGASIGTGTGIALSEAKSPEPKRVIALAGDSSFLHSGFAGLVDAVRTGARLLVIILENFTTALSGGQPHPGSGVNVYGETQRAVSLASLAREAGADWVCAIDVGAGEDVRGAIEMGLGSPGVSVVVASGPCHSRR